jgi:hypothetical protein
MVMTPHSAVVAVKVGGHPELVLLNARREVIRSPGIRLLLGGAARACTGYVAGEFSVAR